MGRSCREFARMEQATGSNFVLEMQKADIRVQRKLERDPNYVPDYLPKPAESAIEVNLTPEAERMLDTLLSTGDYLENKEQALLNCFLRYYDGRGLAITSIPS